MKGKNGGMKAGSGEGREEGKQRTGSGREGKEKGGGAGGEKLRVIKERGSIRQRYEVKETG